MKLEKKPCKYAFSRLVPSKEHSVSPTSVMVSWPDSRQIYVISIEFLRTKCKRFSHKTSLSATSNDRQLFSTLRYHCFGIIFINYQTLSASNIYFLFVFMQLPEACEMSAKIGERSIRRNIKAFALQNFGILLGFAIMLILALYGETISVK